MAKYKPQINDYVRVIGTSYEGKVVEKKGIFFPDYIIEVEGQIGTTKIPVKAKSLEKAVKKQNLE